MRLMFAARAVDHTAGGVERMIVTLMNALAIRGHEIDLFTWDRAQAELFYPLERDVSWHRLNVGDPNVRASKGLMLRRARTIRSLVGQREPEVIVCFQDGPFMAMRAYTLGLRIPIVAAERNAPSRFNHISAARYQPLIYQSLRFAARIIVQCESYQALYPGFLRKRIVCIANPVLPVAEYARPDVPGSRGRYRLLSVGRLSFQKNHEVLIEAFARLATKFPNWDLAIIGEGEQHARLKALIKVHNLENRVILPGTTKSIAQWYTSSHLFCLGSRWEGFPNALAEALAHGLPAIGFSDCAGVRDLIVHGVSGLLAAGNDDTDSLVIVLEAAMSSHEIRRSMGNAAIGSVQRFDPSTVFSQWEQVLSQVAQGQSVH